MLREGFQESKWKWMDDRWIFPLGIDSPPLNGHNFQTFFIPLFTFALESYIYETDFSLGLSQKYHF